MRIVPDAEICDIGDTSYSSLSCGVAQAETNLQLNQLWACECN